MANQSGESNGYVAKLHAGEHVIPAADKGGIGDLTVKINVDVSEALTGLKALRREADAAVRSLKALDEALGSVSLRHVPIRPEVSE